MDHEPAGRSGTGPGGTDELLAAFARWSADERVADAGRQRSRERWLRQQASGSATLIGILTDLAEARAEVVATTRARPWSGTVVGVGRDFCVMEDRTGAGILVALTALVSVATTGGGRSVPVGRDPGGDREAPLGLRLIDALTVLAAERSPVRLSLGPDHLVSGDLTAVGTDVVTVRMERPERAFTTVAVAQIQACLPC